MSPEASASASAGRGARSASAVPRGGDCTAVSAGAAVFTRDDRRGEAVARRIEAGSTFVNSLVASDPRLPFGGIKESGYGRELGSYGIREFVNVKTVYVKRAAATQTKKADTE
jgi:succinate-semialdehyde dehydrogenase/glutarate-semialdehyde dehydrogenase